jgi:DNA invertase Pin-like site-specific DNA recombinase
MTTAPEVSSALDTSTRPQCGVYLRISDDPGNDELGVQRQEKWGRKFCDEFTFEPVIYRDNDTSATSGKARPRYEAMLAAVGRGELRAVAAWGQDRLCRVPAEFEVFRSLAKAHSVLFATRSGIKNLARAADTFNARNEGNAAAYEIEQMRERMVEAFTQLAGDGRPWWPQRPFGYTMPKRGEKRGEWVAPQPVAAEADAIAKAYDDVQAGRSLKDVARQWNTAGILTPKGNQWNGMAVRALLLNCRNAGLRAYKGEIVGKAVWQGIVTEQTYRAVHSMLSDPARLTPGAGFATGRKHLLSGLAMCSECNAPLTSAPAPQPGSSPRYACKAAGCMKTKRSMADVDAVTIAHIVDILADADNVEALTRRRDVDTAALVSRLREIDGEKNKAAKMIGAKQITLGQLAVINADYDAEAADIDGQMRDAAKYAVLQRFIAADDVEAVFDAMTLDEQRAVVRLLVTVTVHPGQAPRRAFDSSLVVVEPKP